MERSKLFEVVMRRISNGVWHTTSLARMQKIMRDGFIMAEPSIPDSERWGTGMGPSMFPLVRHLGGVSLFCFERIKLEHYDNSHPLSNYKEFIPYRTTWEGAVWVRLNPDRLNPHFLDPDELVESWKRGLHKHRVMPRIEAAHIGDIPIECIEERFYVCSDGIIDNIPGL